MGRKNNSGLKISIFDDHDSVRDSYRRWLELEGFKVVGAESSMENCMQIIRKSKPDIILMDIDIPGDDRGGLAAAKKITEGIKRSRIIFISHYNEPDIIAGAFNSGAYGYFSKSDELKCLKEAINKVNAGDFYLSPSALKKFLKEFIKKTDSVKSSRKRQYRLTEQETLVIQYIAQGMSNKEIADRLVSNEKRIKNIVSHILAKVEAKNRAHAV